MKSINLWGRIVAVAALLLLVAGGTAFAQLQTGNLYGTVTDDKGAALPGVTATLTGNGAPQVQVTNAQGQFRFLGLGPGGYQLKAELEGFSTIDYPNIVINVGRNTQIEVKLSAAVEDVITVTAESPLLDERRISTGATVSQTELEKIPTSRDPWSILQTTPGVLTDRINVGGNESGQQSQYVGPGSTGAQAVWSVDGVVITDMAALGSSPAYYDFDAFEEMQVTTGGSDSTIATGGVVLNMVTKRGTNEWRGSGRFYDTDEKYQSNLNFNDSQLAKPGAWNGNTTQSSFKQGNRIVSVKDFGAELGGPIVKDRLWIWGSYGRQKVSLLTISDVSDKTDLKTYNGKLNAQIASNNSATAFILDSDKVKIGRNAGPTRPQETTWNQGHFGPKPTAWKAEDTHIFSSNFYLTGLYSKVEGGFQLAPQGGLTPTPYLDGSGVWHYSFLLNNTLRPQTQYKADASNFFNTGSVSHELKFGAAYRDAEVTSLTQWSGDSIVENPAAAGTNPANGFLLALTRDGGPVIDQTYKDVYAQDTMTSGNLTFNLGVRYDIQGGDNLAHSQPANTILPNVLPAVSVSKHDIGFEWKDFTPRLGITYALGAERKTLLRASYSRFADQLGTGTGSFLNPLGGVSYAYFYTTNTGQPSVNPGQIINLGDGPVFRSGNIDPRTGGLLSSNALDSGLSAPKTDELLLGVEHALLPEFVVGVNLTYRKISNLLVSDLLVFNGDAFAGANLDSVGRRVTRADYVKCGTPGYPNCLTGTRPNGSTYSIPFYVINNSLSTRNGGFLRNSDNEQEYKGAALTFNKRLANRWMLRGNVSYSDWTWSKVPDGDNPDPTEFLGGGRKEGDPVLQGSGTGSGSKGGVYINSKWSYSVNGLYQIAPDHPWGFNVALNLNGRQGYPVPYFRRVFLPANYNGASENVQVTSSPDSFRLDDIHIVDARVEKEFTFSDFGLTLGVDCFNLFNEGYVLQRNHRLNQASSDFVREITSPRVLRFGARLSFR
ncbi:MAG TPA: TonB-dependent receptor [Thermoanaerobaculia bacterium]|nr:TonB-dependent receptor [Thermoanaerobaculia bacterium]